MLVTFSGLWMSNIKVLPSLSTPSLNAVKKSEVTINQEQKEIVLHLTVDKDVSSISDYFEIFLGRMLLCRRAAERLGMTFGLNINGLSMM